MATSKHPVSAHQSPALDAPSIFILENHAPVDDLHSQLIKHGLELGEDGYIHWKKSNRSHPRNWSTWRKIYDFGLLIFLDFFTTVISTAGTPASEQARLDLNIGRTLALFSFTSIYMLAQAIGGVFFPPYSESYGRKKLFIIATGLYCVFSIIIAVVPHLAAILIGRFVMGATSALPTIVIAGSAEDIFNSGKRIWMIFAWAVAANVGICMGPIVGTFVTASLGWSDCPFFVSFGKLMHFIIGGGSFSYQLSSPVSGFACYCSSKKAVPASCLRKRWPHCAKI